MKLITDNRLSYRLVCLLALFIELGAFVCLTPLNGDPERIAGFAAVPLIAWSLNAWSRRTEEYAGKAVLSASGIPD
jgi:hypothetical protein